MADLRIEGGGIVIRALREKKGLSVNEMARQLGWDPSRLSLYENDKRALSLKAVQEICDVMAEQPRFIILQLAKCIGFHPEGEMLSEINDSPAKFAMILCSKLTKAEQRRLEALDSQVSQILTKHDTGRHFWIGRASGDERQIELVGVLGLACSLSPDQVITSRDRELLAEIKRQVVENR